MHPQAQMVELLDAGILERSQWIRKHLEDPYENLARGADDTVADRARIFGTLDAIALMLEGLRKFDTLGPHAVYPFDALDVLDAPPAPRTAEGAA